MRRPSTTRRYASRPAPTAATRATARRTTAAPRLTPRTAAPRLGTPLTLSPTLRTPTSGRFTSRYRGIASITGRPTCYASGNLFRGYYGSPFRSRFSLGLGFGSNCFYQPWTWGFGLSWGYSYYNPWSCWNGPLTPYGAFQTSFWNSCYNDCYWNSWCQPAGLSWNYWWYPRSTYCPTYLYVPGSLVVVDGYGYGGAVGAPAGPDAVVASAPAAPAAPAAPEEDDSGSPTPATLAKKYVELGDFYFENGRYDDAAKTYAKARNYLPDDAGIHFVLADAVFANGDYHYAAFLIAEGVRLDPTIVTATTDKRDFYGDKAEFDAQMDALGRHLDAKPYDAWAHVLMGYNLRFSGRPMQALASFRRALELDSGNRAAQAFVDDLVAPEREASKPEADPVKKTG